MRRHDWACVLCDHCIQNDEVSKSASSRQCACPFYSSCAGFFGKAHHPSLSAPIQPRFGSLWLLSFPKVKIAIEMEVICECDGHTIHELSHWHLTANWLVSRKSECSWMRSKVSSDWLPSYVKATWSVLDIHNGYFPDSPRTFYFLIFTWPVAMTTVLFQLILKI